MVVVTLLHVRIVHAMAKDSKLSPLPHLRKRSQCQFFHSSDYNY